MTRASRSAASAADRTAASALVAAVRAALREHADAERAPQMQAYMKSELPFRGVAAPEVRRLCRSVFSARPLPGRSSWEMAVRELYDGARYREERYGAIALLGDRRYREHRCRPEALALYRHLIVTGAWWDLVDPIATRHLGELLGTSPRPVARRMRAWAGGRDVWCRRSAILCQLGRKDDTDVELLADCIRPSIERREFFLRKAIGWALREYAKTDPEFVVGFVDRHRDDLSALSRREALRRVR